MAVSHADILALAQRLGEALRERALRVATVESCTGGWIAKAITDVAGSSAWFEAGWVTYSNPAKAELVGVSLATLERYGAVSEQTVAEMATGGLARWPRAALAVAVSGIAGPDGGSADKPVGLVWFAWADGRAGAAARLDCEWRRFDGDREAVRAATVAHALRGVLERL